MPAKYKLKLKDYVGSINVPKNKWEECGTDDDPQGRLIATLEVNGVYLHLEAFAVTVDEEGIQRADVYDDSFEKLHSGFGGDGAFNTFTHSNGREYAIFASPFC